MQALHANRRLQKAGRPGALGLRAGFCGDRAFDHGGERRVSNALLVLARDVVIVDDDVATCTPPEMWAVEDEGTGFLGEGYALGRARDARALWVLNSVDAVTLERGDVILRGVAGRADLRRAYQDF